MLTRLFVLGLLARQPMSGYVIQTALQVSRTEQWLGILPGSVYHALKKLASEGFVVLQATEYEGNRAKAIYAITPAGEEEFRRLLRETWRMPALHFPSGIYAALSFLEDLPKEEVLFCLDEQIAALEKELADWNAGEVIKSEFILGPMPDYIRAFFANGREHMEVDLRFMRYLREALPSAQPLAFIPSALEEKNS
jgi:DNA-binding PadR family transcriptional regulator